MPAFWITSYDDVTGDVVLSDGQTFNVNDIPGNGWPQARLDRLRDRLLELTDHRERQSDLPVDDEERTMDNTQLQAIYGGRRFLDGQDIVSRSVDYEVTWDGARLHFRSFRQV